LTANGPAFRLLPRLEPENEFFWTSGADGRLRFLRCQDCRSFIHPPYPRCPDCLSADVAVEPVSGRASLVAYTVNEHPWMPGGEPYIIGLVAIDEQESVRLTTNLVGVEPADVVTGMALEVTFEQCDDVYLPLFRPVGGSPS